MCRYVDVLYFLLPHSLWTKLCVCTCWKPVKSSNFLQTHQWQHLNSRQFYVYPLHTQYIAWNYNRTQCLWCTVSFQQYPCRRGRNVTKSKHMSKHFYSAQSVVFIDSDLTSEFSIFLLITRPCNDLQYCPLHRRKLGKHMGDDCSIW